MADLANLLWHPVGGGAHLAAESLRGQMQIQSPGVCSQKLQGTSAYFEDLKILISFFVLRLKHFFGYQITWYNFWVQKSS